MNIKEIYNKLNEFFENDEIKSYYLRIDENFQSIDIEFHYNLKSYRIIKNYQIILNDNNNLLELIKFNEEYSENNEDDFEIDYILELEYMKNQKLDYISIIFYELKNQYLKNREYLENLFN